MVEGTWAGMIFGGIAGAAVGTAGGDGPGAAVGALGGGIGGMFSSAHAYYNRLKEAEEDWENAKGMLKAARFWRKKCEADHNAQHGH